MPKSGPNAVLDQTDADNYYITEENRMLRWVVDNIYTIARREHRRAEDGKPLRPEMWLHILRLCEKAGAQKRTVGVLRATPE